MKNTLMKTVAIFALLLVLLGIYAGIRHFQKQLPPPPGLEPVKISSPPIQQQEKMVRKVDFKFVDGEHEIKFNQVPLVVKKEGIEGNILKTLVEKIPELATATIPSQHLKAAPGDFERLIRGDEIEQVDREKTLIALEVALKQAQDAATITVPLAKKPGDGPESFNNKRKEMGFNTLIASFTTFHEGHVDDDNRNVNLKIAVEKIDGLIIQPGKKFSFNKVVGPRTEKCGFKKAGVISQ
ncbi:MAG: VanW family protein, partial [Candidatus Riflebacteria bacterium]